MAEDFEGTLSLREEVDADLSGELVAALHASFDSAGDVERFRSDLIRVLTRYELYREAAHKTPKKERRAQLTKLRDKATQLIEAMNALASDVTRNLDNNLSAVTEDARWDGWSFDDDVHVPNEDTSIADAEQSARNIIAACQMELDLFEETKGAKRGSANPALDQLLSDLAAIFENATDRLAQSQCYRDELTEEGYSGAFFVLAKQLLDTYAPKVYGTPAALGIRILRVLKER